MLKRKSNNASPEIPTAALPDIIFILLFFFMVTVTPKPVEDLVEGKSPKLEELTKVEEKYKIHIKVGKPLNASLGAQPAIQVMNEIVDLDQIRFAVDNYRQTKLDPASRNKRLVASIEADFKLSYGLINDMQEELRKAGVFDVLYLAGPEE